jgi:hypothetical protein
MEPYTKHSEKCQISERFQESLQKTQSRNGDSHIAGVSVGVKMEEWRTTGCRHFLRGPSGTTGSSSTRTRTRNVRPKEARAGGQEKLLLRQSD